MNEAQAAEPQRVLSYHGEQWVPRSEYDKLRVQRDLALARVRDSKAMSDAIHAAVGDQKGRR